MRKTMTVLALAALGLTACGTTTLDAEDLENQLRQQFTQSSGVQIREVDCPDDIEPETGRRFDCTVTGPSGATAPANVELTNDEGQFRATLPQVPQ
jgi:hypothetical protein